MAYYKKTKIQTHEKDFNNFLTERLRDLRNQATNKFDDKPKTKKE